VKARATVRRTGPGQWTVTRPRLGFGPPELHTAPTAAAAWRWLRRIAPAPGRGAHAGTERARNVATALATRPRWDQRLPYVY